jgi:tRNA (cmo5U34)-methyltransferase
MQDKDRIFLSEFDMPGDFVFDERVVRVFPDMIGRSVPGYGLIVPMTAMLARRYAQDASVLYDLGCSLGAVSLAMRCAVTARDVRIVAVDSSEAMVERLRGILEDEDVDSAPAVPVQVVRADVRDTAIDDASVVVLNFTLQFIDPPHRLTLLTRIRQGMRPGGVLVLSEKLRFENEEEQRLQTQWHHDFKRAQGYSDLEIARKRDALERVMLPDTLSEHCVRLEQAGFSRVIPWFQALNFRSLVAFA